MAKPKIPSKFELAVMVLKKKLKPFLQIAKILVFFGLWYLLNAVYNVYNKKVLNKVNVPWTLAILQFFIGCIWFLPLWITGLRKAPKFAAADMKWLLPLGLFHGMVHISSVVAMGAGGVSFFQIIKAAEPLFTAVVSAIFFREIFHPVVYLCVLPVVGGVAYASVSTLDFSWLAFAGAMMSNIGSVLRAVLSKPKLSDPPETTENLSPGNLFSLITLISLFLSAPFAILMEFDEIMDLAQQGDVSMERIGETEIETIAIWAFVSGITFYTYNEVAYYALAEVHPVTHAVGNTLKRVVVITAAVLFLHESMTTEMAIGTAVAITGVLCYSLAKHHFKKDDKKKGLAKKLLKKGINSSAKKSSSKV